MALSDKAQALVMLVAFVLVPLMTWSALGFPTDRVAIGLLVSNIIAGILLFFKEYAGVTPTEPPKPT